MVDRRPEAMLACFAGSLPQVSGRQSPKTQSLGKVRISTKSVGKLSAELFWRRNPIFFEFGRVNERFCVLDCQAWWDENRGYGDADARSRRDR